MFHIYGILLLVVSHIDPFTFIARDANIQKRYRYIRIFDINARRKDIFAETLVFFLINGSAEVCRELQS